MKQLIYQLLPRLWGNGRFSSIDQASLDYLKDTLGMDWVWCTGVIRHATRLGDEPQKVVKGDAGSPYAITDYYDVNPYLADDPAARMQEFQALVDRIHAAGLKVIIDYVPNHVARENVNFGTDDDKSVHWAPENDFYYYPGEALRLPVDAHGYEEFPARASGNVFTSAPTVNDWYETVKLNYGETHTFSLEGIGLDWGLGLRLNLDFILLRLDAGARVHDPARDAGDRWVHPGQWFSGSNIALHFGVGYPF